MSKALLHLSSSHLNQMHISEIKVAIACTVTALVYAYCTLNEFLLLMVYVLSVRKLSSGKKKLSCIIYRCTNAVQRSAAFSIFIAHLNWDSNVTMNMLMDLLLA